MNHLVFLGAHTGELEKILSGVKTMIVKDLDPTLPFAHPVNPGDSLYFLRDEDDCSVRVKATVVRVQFLTIPLHEDLSQTLKELQPRLQLTENQYNFWSNKKQVLLIEFEGAHKISAVQVNSEKIADRSDWIPFEAFNRITE